MWGSIAHAAARLAAIALGLLLLASGPREMASAQAVRAGDGPAAVAQLEREVVERVNRIRGERGLPALEPDAELAGFVQLPPGAADRGLARLADDLRSGRWHTRYGVLSGQASADLGYRLVVGLPGAGAPAA